MHSSGQNREVEIREMRAFVAVAEEVGCRLRRGGCI